MNLEFVEKLRQNFLSREYQFRSEKELCRLLGCYKEYEKTELKQALNALITQGEIVLDANKKYLSAERAGAMRGRIQGGDKGFAFFVPENKSLPDLFIPGKALRGAMDGDTVLARKSVKASATSDEGEVLTVLSRGITVVTGVFEAQGKELCGFVTPKNHAFLGDLYIPWGKTAGAKTGDRVAVQITEYPSHGYGGEGVITEILTAENALILEEESLIREAELPTEFSPVAEKEGARAAKEPVAPYLETRADDTHLYTVTIDGADTRDIDDAVSVEREGENVALYVHIADVSHYVKQGSAVDREAFQRGNSVYFPDRVYPMLPKSLSNGACSLNEGEIRLALTCKTLFSAEGKPLKSELYESVIRSNRRLTYDTVNALLLRGESTGDSKTDQALILMNFLAKALAERRTARGAVNLEVKESGIYYDSGKVTVFDKTRGDGEKLIEEFMIAANEAVASFAAKRKLPFVYRVHESPSAEKLAAFSAFACGLGLPADFDEEVTPSDFQNILEISKEAPYYSVLSGVMLRAMQKARYQGDNVGHFGLASDCYCHFTSPIRRYPDLMVHRVLKAALRGGKEKAQALKEPCLNGAAQANVRERISDEIERDVDDLYKTYYMSQFIGKEFSATVSGVTGFGVFAQTEDSCEGLIRPEELPKDVYEFRENEFALVGKTHAFRLGEKITVRVTKADLTARKVDFTLVTEEAVGGKIYRDAVRVSPSSLKKKEKKPTYHAPKKAKGKGGKHSKSHSPKGKKNKYKRQG